MAKNLQEPVQLAESIVKSFKRLKKHLDADQAAERISQFQTQMDDCLEASVEGTVLGNFLMENFSEELVYKLWDIYNE